MMTMNEWREKVSIRRIIYNMQGKEIIHAYRCICKQQLGKEVVKDYSEKNSRKTKVDKVRFGESFQEVENCEKAWQENTMGQEVAIVKKTCLPYGSTG